MIIKTLLFIHFILLAKMTFAEDDICKYFKYCGGGGSSRSGSQSLPSASSAANLNPSNISKVKGLGLESIYQSGNAVLFNLVSGNGKIGALVSPTLENSFFGNRAVEIDDLYLARRIDKKQYKTKKLNLAVGLNLIEKKNISFDIGISAKRNPDIKDINPGTGVSLRLFNLNLGAFIYKDDVKINLGNYVNPYTNIKYNLQYSNPTYQENFWVQAYTMGLQISSLSLDAGLIKTHYNFYSVPTEINLFSAAYTYNKWLFNIAKRSESSMNLAYDNHNLYASKNKTEYYYGIQYLMNSHMLWGVSYNYFLLHEASASLVLYL